MRKTLRTRKKRLHTGRYVAGGLALIVIAVLLALLLQPGPLRTLGKALAKVPGTPVKCALLGDTIVYLQEDSLFCVNTAGKKLWGFSGAAENMVLVPAPGRLAVSISATLQAVGEDGKLQFSASYPYPIQALRAGKTLCAVLQYRENNQRVVAVLDVAGKELDTFFETATTAIVDFGIFGDQGNGFWLLVADTSGIRPLFKFYTYKYDPAKRVTFTYTESDQILYRPVFYANRVALLGSQRVIWLDLSGKALYQARVQGYEFFAADESKATQELLLYPLSPQGKRPETLYTLRALEGEEYRDITLPEPILAATVTARYYYVFTRYNCYRYQKNNLQRVQYPLPDSVSQVTAAPGAVLLTTDTGFYRMALE